MGVGGLVCLVVGVGGWSLSLRRALRLKRNFSNAKPINSLVPRLGLSHVMKLNQHSLTLPREPGDLRERAFLNPPSVQFFEAQQSDLPTF